MKKEKTIGIAYFRIPGQAPESICGEVFYNIPKEKISGFLFHPFLRNGGNSIIFIKNEHKKIDSIELPQIDSDFSSTKKEEYIAYVERIKQSLAFKQGGKVVAARLYVAKTPTDFNPEKIFQELVNEYTETFISMVYIPGQLLWIGNTPEILLKEKNTKFLTYSLAGTRKTGTRKWGEKELEEQAIVTKFICKKLSGITKQNIVITAQNTIKMGIIEHIKNEIIIEKDGLLTWDMIAKKLHPTPAVCGVPEVFAKEFISEHENFCRGYYSGYLGPINYKKNTVLFVNLRCMQATKDKLYFYAGCGVTANSIAEKEWDESTAKLSLLRKIAEK